MRCFTFRSVLIFFFLSLFLISAPQILYAHSGGSSHEHPHDPEKSVCMDCAELDTPGSHFCPVNERQEQEQDVEISNERANRKRLEEQNDDDGSIGDAVEETIDDNLSNSGKFIKRVIKAITGIAGSVQCQGCENWVETELIHWGTGGCAIGHEHWTCKESERQLHGGCYYVDEPETNPDAMYEGSMYSMTCLSCGNVSYTNNYGEYMRWTSSSYCSTCRSQYGY